MTVKLKNTTVGMQKQQKYTLLTVGILKLLFSNVDTVPSILKNIAALQKKFHHASKTFHR